MRTLEAVEGDIKVQLRKLNDLQNELMKIQMLRLEHEAFTEKTQDPLLLEGPKQKRRKRRTGFKKAMYGIIVSAGKLGIDSYDLKKRMAAKKWNTSSPNLSRAGSILEEAGLIEIDRSEKVNFYKVIKIVDLEN